MKLVDKNISVDELKTMASQAFGGLVKGVVDVKKGIMVVDAEMHADEEKLLLESGSDQDDVWGINLYPEKFGDDFIEFDSMINIRPRLNNFSRGVDDGKLREKIISLIHTLVAR